MSSPTKSICYILSGIVLFFLIIFTFAMLKFDIRNCPMGFCVRKSNDIVIVDDIGILSSPLYMAATVGPWLWRESRVVVRIDSAGGPMRSARLMSWWTGWLTTRTEVRFELPAGATCQSSCTYFWSSTRERSAHPAARFMFHGPARGTARRAGAGLEDSARLMEDGIRRVDPVLADVLTAAGAFVPASDGVWKNAESIAELGGDYLRLDPTLR